MLTILLIIAFWLWCCYMSFGYTYADFMDGAREDEWREAAGIALLLSILGPISLVIAFLVTGFGQHGRLYPTTLKGGKA